MPTPSRQSRTLNTTGPSDHEHSSTLRVPWRSPRECRPPRGGPLKLQLYHIGPQPAAKLRSTGPRLFRKTTRLEVSAYGSACSISTVEAIKLEYVRPPITKRKKENQPESAHSCSHSTFWSLLKSYERRSTSSSKTKRGHVPTPVLIPMWQYGP